MITKKKIVFKLLIATLIVVVIFFGILKYAKLYSVSQCAEKELIKKIIENVLDKKDISITSVFSVDDSMCGFVIKMHTGQKFVIYADKHVDKIFIGDIIDVKNRRIIGYEKLQGENN